MAGAPLTNFDIVPHGASHFFAVSLSLALNSSGSPHSALKLIIQVANVNSATLDVDLKCSPTDFRRSWRSPSFFLFTIPAEL
jgi:hypothetical protein